jgi:large subunit ribosomal protein L25
MKEIALSAQERSVIGRATKNLRIEGWVPAVVYGPEFKATHIQINAKECEKVISEAGRSHLVSLTIANKKPVKTLVKEIQRDVTKHFLKHLDFYAVVMTEKVKAEISVRMVGKAPAVADKGGILVQGMNVVEIECLPGDLVDVIEVDISGMVEMDSIISASDLVLPKNIALISDPDTMVAKIEAPRLVEEELAEGAAAAGEPELIRAERKVEEEEK